jgi:drug/metabolite transporter (DMT)-like permease
MIKKLFFLALAAGVLAGIGGIIYDRIYREAMATDFSKIVNPAGIFATCIIGCILASGLYWVLNRLLKDKTDIVFNLLFATLSFATILSPFSTKLPLDVQSPELFPGLTVPMHFFPVLAWLVLKPLFIKDPYLRIA